MGSKGGQSPPLPPAVHSSKNLQPKEEASWGPHKKTSAMPATAAPQPNTRQRAPPAALVPPRQPCPFIPYGCQKQPVMTYGTKEARPLGAGRRRAGSPVWEWINDHWHASAPHSAPIHPPPRATHPSRAMDRKTVFSTGSHNKVPQCRNQVNGCGVPVTLQVSDGASVSDPGLQRPFGPKAGV